MRHLVSVFLLLACSDLCAAEPPIPVAERGTMLAAFREQVVTLTRAIEESPSEPTLYSRRGDRHLFLAEFAQAVTDFKKMIALDPALDAPHWRLGIAYYFTGQFAKSAKQFEKYHAYDNGDRENGLWKYLGDVTVLGRERARTAMLAYHRFDREPFPDLYALFVGTKTTREFFAGLEARQLTGIDRVMFFANYYAGLHEDLLGNRARALELLHAAVANPWGRTAENGPAYMWQVARLHYEKLAAEKR